MAIEEKRLTDARHGLSAAPRLALAHGRVHFWQGGSLWIGRGHGLCDWHDHHAHQIALALDGECRFRSEAEGAWAPFDGAIVPSHCLHQFVVQDSTEAHLFIEPETVEGHVLTRRFAAGAIAPLPDEARRSMAAVLLGAHRAREGGAEMVSTAKKALALLTGATMQAAGVDARITKALVFLRARVRTPVSLADAASAAAVAQPLQARLRSGDRRLVSSLRALAPTERGRRGQDVRRVLDRRGA